MLAAAAQAANPGQPERLPSDAELITPVEKMFVWNAMPFPRANPLAPGKGELRVDGLVDHELNLDYPGLAKLPQESHVLTNECFANRAGGPLIGTLEFAGVSFQRLKRLAGTQDRATAVRIETADKHSPFILPLAEVDRADTLLVNELNRQTVPLKYGGPYTRLMIPGAGGNHLPKYVTRITFVDEKAPLHPAPVMAGFLSPMPPAGGTVRRPTVEVSGYGFAGPEYVNSIEISTDNGTTFREIPFPKQPTPYVWTHWHITWKPPQAGYYALKIRAVSSSGKKQGIPGSLFLEVV